MFFFTKDDLVVIVTCFTDKESTGTLNPLEYSIWDIIAGTYLWRKAWTVCKPQRSSECYQRQMAWCWWSDNEKCYFAEEKAFSSSGKAEWRTYSAHFLLISLTDDYCDVLVWPDAYDRRHEWCTACKHCFVTCNTISFVSRLIHRCFSQRILDLFEDVCSLNMCFSLHLFWLLCCIMTWESSGRFYAPPGIWRQ